MSASRADPAAERTLCRACGAPVAVGARRCGRCLTDLVALEADPTAFAPVAPSRPTSPAIVQTIGRRLTRRRVLLLVVLALAAWRFIPGLIPPSPIASAEGARTADASAAWGYVHGDAGATRATSMAATLDGDAAWSASLGALGAPVVADGAAIYAVTADRRLVAIAREDGATLWTRTYEFTLTSPPTAADGRLFILQRGGGLQALDATTGDVIWETEPLGAYGVAPIVVDGSVYLFFGLDNDGQETGLVSQVDAETGRVLWRASASRAFPGTGMAVGAGAIAVIGGQTLELYDRGTGERSFWYTFRYGAEAVAVEGDAAYVVTSHETAAISLEAERPWWDGVRGLWNRMNFQGMAPTPPPVPTIWFVSGESHEPFAPVISASAMIVADRAGTVRAHDRESGEVRWSTGGAAVTAAPLLTTDGILVARGETLSLVDAQTGATIAEHAAGAAGDAIVQVIPTDAGAVTVSAAGVIAQLTP